MSERLTDDELRAIRGRCERAGTPQWVIDRDGAGWTRQLISIDVPRLLDEVERLRGENAALRELVLAQQKTVDLAFKGMESMAEQMHDLKQRDRTKHAAPGGPAGTRHEGEG